MYFRINNGNYARIKSLGFNPETDLTNNSLPINEFEAMLYTNSVIADGQWADIYDDDGNLWAHYWLRYAERHGMSEDQQTYIVKLIGQSPLAFLERVILPSEYLDCTAYGAIMDVLDYVGNMGQAGDIIEDSDVADELDEIDIDGFAPEQTARERLQWLLLISGAYVRSYFDTTIHIEMISNADGASIPMDKTFWKPSVSFRDYVTKLIVHSYSYVQKYPDPDDDYVTDGTDYWVVTEQKITVTNSNAPHDAPENEVEINGVTLLSPSRASAVLTNLIGYYFNRIEINADVINNGTYTPGDRVAISTDAEHLYQGYIDRCSFRFGYQARSSLHITGALSVESAKLTVNYVWESTTVATKVYMLPKGYAYTIDTEYIDYTTDTHRYIFRPNSATITGTLSADATVTVAVQIALDFYVSGTDDLATILEQEIQVTEWIESSMNAERSLVTRKTTGKKRTKYLNQIATEEQSLLNKTTNAFAEMAKDTTDTAHFLHIVSVDEVDYKEEEIVDPDNQTVVIS